MLFGCQHLSTGFLPLYGSQPLGITWQAHPIAPRDVTHTCRPLLCLGMERLRDEVGKETVEAPSAREGNEKGTTALPHGGRPTFLQSHSPPLTEITRDFPGKTGMEILLTSHLKRQNTSEQTLFPLVTHNRLLIFSKPLDFVVLIFQKKKKLYNVFPAVQRCFVYWSEIYFILTLMIIYNLVGSLCFPSQTFSWFY